MNYSMTCVCIDNHINDLYIAKSNTTQSIVNGVHLAFNRALCSRFLDFKLHKF